jgi:beta-alanine--pyruvate transaminase
MDLLEREHAMDRVTELAPLLETAVHALRGAPHVTDIRNYGLAAGLTLAPYPGEIARRPFEVAMACWRKGFYVRFGVDTLQLAPPFISTPAQIDSLVNALGEALHEQAP